MAMIQSKRKQIVNSNPLQLNALGGLQFKQDGKPVAGFVSSKVQALLIYLAATKRSHLRESLASLFWGEMSDTDAKTNLRQALANLRSLIPSHLIITRDSVEFDRSAPYELDVEIFEERCKFNNPVRFPLPDLSAEDLEEALALYQGDFLEGFHAREAFSFEDWALLQREYFREIALRTLTVLIEHYSSIGDYPNAITYARRLLGLEPWREEAHRQLMMLLVRSGQRSAALEQYEVCRRSLDQELGIAPSIETSSLHDRILSAALSRRHNLPAQSTLFVGRENDLDLLYKRLNDPSCRLLTLLGPGGIGKTRLALQAAGRSSESFLYGACFIPLVRVPAGNPDMLTAAIAEGLQLSTFTQSPSFSELLNYLREKEILLVLDNFEHLLDASHILTELLEKSHHIKMLVTSHFRLNLYGEWVIEVGEMQIPIRGAKEVEGLQTDPAKLADKYDAVQLFVQSAQRNNPRFALTQENFRPVIRVCQQVGGLPLGIELAASWVRNLSLQNIASELEKSLGFLESTYQDMPERHHSLQAIFDYSWGFLSRKERNLFAALSIFRAGFEKSQAMEVTGASERLLAALADQSLLRRSMEGRYELHHVLQQFGQAKLAASQTRLFEMQERHARAYGKFIRQRESALKGKGQKQALVEIGMEIENLRAGWDWSLKQANEDLVEDYIEGLYHFYLIRGWFQQGVDAFGLARQVMERKMPSPAIELLLGKIMAREAKFHQMLSSTEQAVELLQRSLVFLRSHVEHAELASALNHLGVCARHMEHYDQARQYFQESLSISVAYDNKWVEANTLVGLGGVSFFTGDLQAAGQFCENGLSLFRELGDLRGMADCLVGLGIVKQNMREYTQSKQYCLQSLEIYRDLDDQFSVAFSLYNLGLLEYTSESYDDALRHGEQSLSIRYDLGSVTGEIECLFLLGDAAFALKQNDDADQYYRRAIRAARKTSLHPLALKAIIKYLEYLARTVQPKDERFPNLLTYSFFVSNSSASEKDTRARAESLQSKLSPFFPASDLAGLRAQGDMLTLENVLEDFS